MSFKNFCKSSESKMGKRMDDDISKHKASNDTTILNESVQDKYEKYSKLSRDELMEEYIKQSKLVKDKGGYSSEQIELLKSTLFPHLNDEQKKYFETLIGMVD